MKVYAPSQFGRVAVLYGGLSPEREVSLTSGNTLLSALQRAGVDAFGIDVGENLIEQLQQSPSDMVFSVLHSGQGEDGTVQALLELMGLPYPGSGVAACALAMDKWRSKLLWKASDLPVLPAIFLTPGDDYQHVADVIDLPYCVKPCSAGSTIGISWVKRLDELPEAVAKARQYSSNIIIEPFVVGREFTVGIVQDQVLPVLEITTPQGFYDYDAKYHSSDTKFHCPADLSKEKAEQIQDIAWRAFMAIAGEGWGRIDFMQDKAGQFWILEMNPLPGMTPRSDIPIAAQALGWSYEEVAIKILSSAKMTTTSSIC
ncbi:MAG: D-alanine--D-alanine ligase [Legionellaceae bacterium]|nr:D-alanine--D-alanine ligase [Legionellaceae bacterium]